MPDRPHLLLLGGFLGAGKTTALRALGGYLLERGVRVGVITNDQGSALVDTALARACGHETAEITGGCFCCRFDDLVRASSSLVDRLRVDAIVAEAVGSCTDLVATVTEPLRRLHASAFTVGPLSVLVDPIRALQVLSGDVGEDAPFTPPVAYIYRKQIEEADVLVMNKCDLVTPGHLARLDAVLADVAPRAARFHVSLRTAAGVDAWFQHIVFGERHGAVPLEIDYARYADGEARLGWLNASVEVRADPATDGNALLARLARAMGAGLRAGGTAVAHLKMTLQQADGSGLASAHLVRADGEPEPGLTMATPLQHGHLLVNLRAEGTPEQLTAVLVGALAQVAREVPGLQLTDGVREAFRPAAPTPTHRDTWAGESTRDQARV